MDRLKHIFHIDSINMSSLLTVYDHNAINHEYEVVGEDLKYIAHRFTKAVDKTLHDDHIFIELEEDEDVNDIFMLLGP